MRSSIVMDHNNIPSCALYRHIGTVIVRVKMEVSSVLCCQRDVCPASECQDSIHRPSRCEQCTRTRLISKCDSDSDVVDKCRPYRSTTARIRYVNVCAAVCLLLLVSGLSPRSSAAPVRSRAVMSRQRRATDYSYLWENPCDYADADAKPNVTNEALAADLLIKAADDAHASATEYKDTFAKNLYDLSTFDKLVGQMSSEWLRKFQFPDEVLPKEKELLNDMPEEYMDKLMTKIDDVLPSMHKALKLIIAGLHSFSTHGLNAKMLTADEQLKNNITKTIQSVRAVLCRFNAIMTVRNLETIPLSHSEIPEINSDNMLKEALPLFRDTLNYLEYLRQVFKKNYGVK